MKSLVLAIGLLAVMPAYSNDKSFESELAGLLQQQSKVISEDVEQRVSQLMIAQLTGAAPAAQQQTRTAMVPTMSPQFGTVDPALLQLAALTVADISGNY